MPQIRKKKTSPAKRSGTVKKNVTTQVYGSDPVEEITVDVLDFEVEPAYVSAKVGATKSLAQYESLRVDVSISVPCVPHPEVIDKTFSSAMDQAILLLDETIDTLLDD